MNINQGHNRNVKHSIKSGGTKVSGSKGPRKVVTGNKKTAP